MLKHQANGNHSADKSFIVLDKFHIKILHLLWTTLGIKLHFEKNK